eukprot:3847744-Pleurochrysis_carterae.AAC.1
MQFRSAFLTVPRKAIDENHAWPTSLRLRGLPWPSRNDAFLVDAGRSSQPSPIFGARHGEARLLAQQKRWLKSLPLRVSISTRRGEASEPVWRRARWPWQPRTPQASPDERGSWGGYVLRMRMEAFERTAVVTHNVRKHSYVITAT